MPFLTKFQTPANPPFQRAFVFFLVATVGMSLLASCASNPVQSEAAKDDVQTQVWMEFTQTAAYSTAQHEAVATLTASAPTPPGGERGEIVFSIDYSTVTEIHVMTVDGSFTEQLVSERFWSGSPTWSPDGTEIAFSSNAAGAFQICLMDIDGHVTDCITDFSLEAGIPSWSPDNTQIAFTSSWYGVDPKIYLIDMDSLDVTYLANGSRPSWSPDGIQIAFDLRVDNKSDIFIMNVDGTNIQNITNDLAGNNGSPSWSPDGTRIAFASYADNKGDIHTINIDGSDLRRLTTDFGSNSHPSWSPDGTEIAFISADEYGNDHIYTLNINSSQLRHVTESTGSINGIDWRP